VAAAIAAASAPSGHGTGVAALIATHNLDLAARMDRVVTLRDGQVVAA
jgi:lipoprotein-releasing system ATP-binding protein